MLYLLNLRQLAAARYIMTGVWIPLRNFWRLFVLLAIFAGLAACIDQNPAISQEQAADIAWEEMLPNTASQSRSNWEVVEMRRVSGVDVVGVFTDARYSNCQGPEPPENQAIKLSSEYWYIHTVPLPATPIPDDTDTGSGSPPSIPEPLMREAFFLIDVYNGQIVARKYSCVEY